MPESVSSIIESENGSQILNYETARELLARRIEVLRDDWSRHRDALNILPPRIGDSAPSVNLRALLKTCSRYGLAVSSSPGNRRRIVATRTIRALDGSSSVWSFGFDERGRLSTLRDRHYHSNGESRPDLPVSVMRCDYDRASNLWQVRLIERENLETHSWRDSHHELNRSSRGNLDFPRRRVLKILCAPGPDSLQDGQPGRAADLFPDLVEFLLPSRGVRLGVKERLSALGVAKEVLSEAQSREAFGSAEIHSVILNSLMEAGRLLNSVSFEAEKISCQVESLIHEKQLPAALLIDLCPIVREILSLPVDRSYRVFLLERLENEDSPAGASWEAGRSSVRALHKRAARAALTGLADSSISEEIEYPSIGEIVRSSPAVARILRGPSDPETKSAQLQRLARKSFSAFQKDPSVEGSMHALRLHCYARMAAEKFFGARN